MMNKKHEMKVAVVTGAGGLLCSTLAKELGRKGMEVALLGRDLQKLEKVEAEIKVAGGEAFSISVDVTRTEEVRKASEIILEKYGPCSILINGAGGNHANAITTINEYDPAELKNENPEMRGFFNLNMTDFHKVLENNTMGTVIPCQVFGEIMAKNGGGSILNFASMSSFRALSRISAYGMAKSSMVSFTAWLAAYLAPANIRVNAIAPGFFINDRSRKLLMTPDNGYTERGGNIMRLTPMKRFGIATELIGCMNWLIDDEASGFVTGITIPVDGGFLANGGI